MQRKLRKACSLPSCNQRIGQCMHCTCDGRCGQHEPGMCGVSREGNGKACKQIGCTRDAKCLHSTRATCCQCRNLIATKSSSATNAALLDRNRQKRRAMAMKSSKIHPSQSIKLLDDYPIKKAKCMETNYWNQANQVIEYNACDSAPYMDDILELLALDMEDLSNDTDISHAEHQDHVQATPSMTSRRRSESPPSLWECEAWQERKSSCNLVIVVDNIQFFVHKVPILTESKTLERIAASKAGSNCNDDIDGTVPVIHVPSAFPGDAHLFEQLCIYWYTGILPASLLTSTTCCCSLNKLPILIAAMEFLEVNDKVQTRVRNLLNVVTKDQKLEPVVCFMNHIYDLTLAGAMVTTPAIQELINSCMQALSQKVQFLTVNDITVLLTLPNEIFSLVVQDMMNRSNEITDQNLARMLKEGRLTKNSLANWNSELNEIHDSAVQDTIETCFMETNWGASCAENLLQSPSGIDMSFFKNNYGLQSPPPTYLDTDQSPTRPIPFYSGSNWAHDTSFASANRMVEFSNLEGAFAV
ncbi:unnamed protein product [Albugo candida]|uniref:BTB domain-containing protein n=1 Tax=Albugo candida TaxID=65357 RepID=A0A024FUA1_9STRA|nr:unnamed protein product [Albugo candida]|eukprot:CCI10606.1 unnamed protein product [Albugo candida]